MYVFYYALSTYTHVEWKNTTNNQFAHDETSGTFVEHEIKQIQRVAHFNQLHKTRNEAALSCCVGGN